MGKIIYRGLAVHFEIAGAGDTVFLLHAGGSSGAQWRKVSTYLGESYRLVTPDFIDCGKTAAWTGASPLSHDDQAGLIRAVIEETCEGPIHLVGHSYGGAIAVRLALASPGLVRSLVLIEPVLMPLLKLAGEHVLFEEYQGIVADFLDHTRAGREMDAWHNFIDYRNGTGAWESLSDQARARLARQTMQTAAALQSNLAHPTTLSDCHRLTMPTLVLRGQQTTAPDRRVTEILHRAIPNCAYGMVSQAGHMSPLTHPEHVSIAIERHIKSHSCRGAKT